MHVFPLLVDMHEKWHNVHKNSIDSWNGFMEWSGMEYFIFRFDGQSQEELWLVKIVVSNVCSR